MSKTQNYQYFVEGEDEKKLIETLKSDLELILPGKIQVFNITQEKLTKLRLRNLKTGTKVVLVFDTDTENNSIFKENIKLLDTASIISEIIFIPQVRNLEDELIRSCKIKQIRELLGSKSNKDFKRDLLKATNLASKLTEHKFDLNEFWSKNDNGSYKEIKNMASKIKK